MKYKKNSNRPTYVLIEIPPGRDGALIGMELEQLAVHLRERADENDEIARVYEHKREAPEAIKQQKDWALASRWIADTIDTQLHGYEFFREK